MVKSRSILILLVFIISIPCFSNSPEFENGFRAFLQEDYKTAIIQFKIATEKDKSSKTLYYLGLSHFHLFQYREARDSLSKALEFNKTDKLMDHQMIINYLGKAIAGLKAREPYNNPNNGNESTFFMVILLGVMGGIGFAASILAVWYFRKYHSGREYKEQPVGADLIATLNHLNHEFKEAKALILKSDSQEAIDDIGEIEDRCIALNDKLEELKYGLRAIDEATFKDEIEITREMITDCVSVAKEVQEV